MRMSVGSRGVFVGVRAVFVSRGCVRLGVFVLADIVKMGRLMVMVSRGVVVSGRLEVMLTSWMFRRLCHLPYFSES
jgi:hypothetical protein